MTSTSATDTLPIPSVSDCRAIGIPMPDLLVSMEDALGAEMVRAFLADKAGRQYAVRRTKTTAGRPHHEVSEWLRTEIGWGTILIPMGPANRSVRLRWAIYSQFRDGQSSSQIARSIGCHIRTVTRNKKELARRGLLIDTEFTTKDPQDDRQ